MSHRGNAAYRLGVAYWVWSDVAARLAQDGLGDNLLS